MKPIATAPDALLLMTSQCAYCPTVLQILGELVKEGRIGRLEVVNIATHPETAAHYGVRSVPWIRLDEIELEGMHSRTELEHWLERSGTPEGLADYYRERLKQGKLPGVISAVRRYPGHLAALLLIARDADTDLTVRVGVSAVMEDFSGTETLQAQLPALIAMSRHSDPRVRSDACHFLSLSGSRKAVEILEALVADPERAVREVARDSLTELRETLTA